MEEFMSIKMSRYLSSATAMCLVGSYSYCEEYKAQCYSNEEAKEKLLGIMSSIEEPFGISHSEIGNNHLVVCTDEKNTIVGCLLVNVFDNVFDKELCARITNIKVVKSLNEDQKMSIMHSLLTKVDQLARFYLKDKIMVVLKDSVLRFCFTNSGYEETSTNEYTKKLGSIKYYDERKYDDFTQVFDIDFKWGNWYYNETFKSIVSLFNIKINGNRLFPLNFDVDAFMKEFTNDKTLLLIYFDNNDNLLGCCQISIDGWNNWTVSRLVVKKEYRHQGVGTALMKKVESLAKAKDKMVNSISFKLRGDASKNSDEKDKEFFKSFGYNLDHRGYMSKRITSSDSTTK